MYLYGGYSGSQRLRDMHAYDFESNSWSPVEGNAGAEMPGGRSSLVAQVYENYIVRWKLHCAFILRLCLLLTPCNHAYSTFSEDTRGQLS